MSKRFSLPTVRWNSVRTKILLLIMFTVILITGLDAWLVPERAASSEHQALEQRALATSAMLADSVRAAVEFDQADSAEDALRPALADELVEWAAVYRDGTRFATVGSGAPQELQRDVEAHSSTSRIVGGSEIVGDTGSLGRVAVALKATGVGARRRETRQVILLQGLIVGLLGAILAFVVVAPIGRAVNLVSAAAERIARGDVSERLDVHDAGGDELGDMARTFQHMNGQLRNLQAAARRVADGDLTVTIEGDGELFAAFRRMIESLRGLTSRISTGSDELSSAAAGMFRAVREQESLATQQNASLEEIRRTLQTLASAATQIARDASAVRETSERSRESSKRMAEQTRMVRAHSDRIGEILTLIQDIADRSDLLALNAALEGTKAGEVGRGFSLVAAEMRRLSEHVVGSVRDIRKLVADMRTSSHASVLATEESTKLANEAAAASAQISDAVARHESGTTQAKQAADEVVRAVNESLTGSAETTRSAESLLELSHGLKNAVRAFNVSEAHMFE